MTSVGLHLTPKRSTIMREQFRAVGLALRKEGVVCLSVVGVLSLLIVASFIYRPNGIILFPFSYGPPGTGLVTLASLFVPFGVWRSEGPSQRSYHWTMPIACGPHTLLKMLSGWLWLIAVMVVYAILENGFVFVCGYIVGTSVDSVSIPLWHWAIPFTAVTITYLLISIAVVGSDHPWRWIGGIVITYSITVSFCAALWWTEISKALAAIVVGNYGMHMALFGTRQLQTMHTNDTLVFARIPDVFTWFKAVLIWLAIGSIGVCLAAYRRRDM